MPKKREIDLTILRRVVQRMDERIMIMTAARDRIARHLPENSATASPDDESKDLE